MIKIFVAYHTPAALLPDPIFCPLHVGRALTTSTKDGVFNDQNMQWLNNNCIGDNTGDNISHLNRQYCELTGIYWVWKNIEKYIDVEYFGFMHYRRHLRFSHHKKDEDRYGQVTHDYLDDEYLNSNGLDSKSINSIISNYDIIIPNRWDVRNVGSKSLYDHYKSSSPNLHIEDYDKVISIVSKIYPDYTEAIQEYNNNPYGFFTNMFVMKKEIFTNYCCWLFSILEEFDKQSDFSLYNTQEYRVDGYLSEWLFGIWLTHNSKKYKIKELQRTFVKNTTGLVGNIHHPQFSGDSINICMATDSNYTKYLSIALESIKFHSNKDKKYDINILVPNLPIKNQEYLTNLSDQNFKIRLINVEAFLDNEYKGQLNIQGSGHITRAAFYRLFIPKIFNSYKKILYLDSDLVVNCDISELFEQDISPNLIGGVRDVELIRWYLNDKFIRKYIDDTLKLSKVSDYINSGVCIMNISALNAFNFTEKSISFLKSNTPIFHDQDVLNKICCNRIKFYDLSWNVEYHIPIWSPNWKNQIPLSLLDPYITSRNHPKIIHYAGGLKPWQDSSVEMGHYFWHFARRSPLYEVLLQDLVTLHLPQNTPVPKSKKSIKYKYEFYKVANKLTMNSSRKLNHGFQKYKQLYKG